MNKRRQRSKKPELQPLQALLDKHPGLKLEQLQAMDALAALLARRYAPAEVLQQLQHLLSRLTPEQNLLGWEGLDLAWMTPETRQRFQQELIHLVTLSEPDREAYLHANESWKSPLGLFRESPEAISDLAELGLEPPCSSADIRQAYRRKARTAHPDRGGDQRAFIRLQDAYRRALAYCL